MRMTRGTKGTRQKVIVMHNPSEIDQNQLLTVNFLKLSSYEVIIPEMTNLSFNIELSSTADPKRTLVSTTGRATVKKLAVKFEGNDMLGVDDFDVYECYRDLWKTELEKKNSVRQGIIYSSSCTEKCIKLGINASDKDDSNKRNEAIADTYGNKFNIPLDFEMLDSSMPY